MKTRLLIALIIATILYCSCDLLIDSMKTTSDIQNDKYELNPFYNINNLSGQSFRSVTDNIFLPTSGKSGTTITWTSSNEEMLSAAGIVRQPKDNDFSIKLIATISKGRLSDKKEFDVIVLGATDLPINSLVVDSTSDWTNLNGIILKASQNAKFAYLQNSTSNNSSIRIRFKVKWNNSGDRTGIILRSTASDISTDGYYFLLYPYQRNYSIIKVVNEVPTTIETGNTDIDSSVEWATISVKVSKVVNQGNPTNQFHFYIRDSLITTIIDNSIADWRIGFGKYNWQGTDGFVLFSTISEPIF